MATKSKTDPTTATTAAAAAAHAARQALAEVRASETALRDKHAALTRERLNTEAALRDRASVLADVDRLVNEAGAKWIGDRAGKVAACVSGELRESASGRAELRRQRPALPDFGPLDLAALCGLAPESVSERLRAAVESRPASEFGLPEAARSQRLAELDDQLAQVEADHLALVEAAGAAGLELRHLDVTANRLEAERRAAEREDELRKQREYQERIRRGEDPRLVERELFPAPPLRSAVVPAAMR